MMSIPTPLVSVALTAFNHEKYIRDAIQSVLRQTVPDVEVVVVDDGSTDGTARAVAEFTDPRVVFIRQENQGPGAALNRAIAACRGRYIALLGGDDVCHPDRIETQLEAYRRARAGVIYSNMDYIDDEGNPLESGAFAKDYFAHPPMSRAQILERLFNTGNFVAAPTFFAEALTLRGVGQFDPVLYQTQDYDWAIRAVKEHEFTFMPRSTVHYRIRNGNANLSAPHPAKQLRTQSEFYLLLRRFFDGVSGDLFREAFREQLVYPDSRSPLELACEQAFLYVRHRHIPLARLIGIDKLHALLQGPEAAAVLQKTFRFNPVGLADLLLQVDVLNQLSRRQATLFVDTGKGFNAEECRRITGNHLAEEFDMTYDLSSFSRVRALCWNPAELQLCQVRLEEVSWRDRAGGAHTVDLAQVTSNGQSGRDGRVAFQHLSPKFFVPIVGNIACVTFRGRWQVVESDRALQEILTSKSWRWLSAIKSLAPFRIGRRAG